MGKTLFPNVHVDQSYEANMADALTLKKFIQYCKKNYPSNHQLLILRSHGNGMGMCPDSEAGAGDRLYTSEITNVLTKNESVDILGLDVCSMAGLENLYQWRPENNSFSASLVIASSPLSGAWAYDRILERISEYPNPLIKLDDNHFEGGNEKFLNPRIMKPMQFAKLIFEEIYDHQRWSSWGLFDNSRIAELKFEMDEASKFLANEQKETIIQIIENTLGYYHNTSNDMELAQLTFPYLDAFHFWNNISLNDGFSVETRSKAERVCTLLDKLVIHSYYGQGFLPETNNFSNGKSGIYQIIPHGNKLFSQTNNTFWSHCNWFHPDDRTSDPNSYGQYDWCIDGAIKANNSVDNFFEFLDFLFDGTNDASGGVNNYRW